MIITILLPLFQGGLDLRAFGVRGIELGFRVLGFGFREVQGPCRVLTRVLHASYKKNFAGLRVQGLVDVESNI